MQSSFWRLTLRANSAVELRRLGFAASVLAFSQLLRYVRWRALARVLYDPPRISWALSLCFVEGSSAVPQVSTGRHDNSFSATSSCSETTVHLSARRVARGFSLRSQCACVIDRTRLAYCNNYFSQKIRHFRLPSSFYSTDTPQLLS